MVYIYILKLQQDNYYVGKTQTPYKRIKEHFDGNGAVFTKKYHPLEIHQIIPDCENVDERTQTLKLMGQYGVDNVRGAEFCKVCLTPDERKLAIRMVIADKDGCYNCGKIGHFIAQCNSKIPQVDPYSVPLPSTSSSILPSPLPNSSDDNEITCQRCFREGHDESNCYAKTKKYTKKYQQMWECTYCDKEFDSIAGVTCHQNLHCVHKPQNRFKNRKYTPKNKYY